MRYYLNASPPPLLLKRLQALEARWQGPSASLPHLTLLSPRERLPDRSEDELITQLLNATHNMSPFMIRLLGIGSFNELENIHICAERSAEIVACHQQLVDATRDLFASAAGTFTRLEHPHMTIADHLPIERRAAAWRALSEEPVREEFLCRQINLLCRTEHERTWFPVFSFPLR
ncbi:MAG: 2'-5' RNA ligase family protein [Candidatus Uhrbacteria bacterium]|nr:2'-5' RNA ligase family protein [Candidatus Uhrbacteria bacterium]